MRTSVQILRYGIIVPVRPGGPLETPRWETKKSNRREQGEERGGEGLIVERNGRRVYFHFPFFLALNMKTISWVHWLVIMVQIPTPWREVFPPPSKCLWRCMFLGFFGGGWSLFPDVLSLLSCFAKFAESGPLPTYVLTNYVPRFSVSFFLLPFILFLLFSEYIYRWCGCYYWWFSLVSKWISTLRPQAGFLR